ncbi:hypothetical protein [Candidatus Binatus sp.]|uniref:hypothetical protein n=1 Tax=Candidatus Binatus sp. TaxID=2811406 RepID=UPI003C6A6339
MATGDLNNAPKTPGCFRHPEFLVTIAVKLVFEVPSISAARAIAPLHGGELFSPNQEWNFQGYRVCDGQDPEGKVVQFRQP